MRTSFTSRVAAAGRFNRFSPVGLIISSMCLVNVMGLSSGRLMLAADVSENIPSDSPRLNLPETLANYSKIDWPWHFAQPDAQAFDSTPADNLTTDAGATLGRVLFYDRRLSASGTISCGTCHEQRFGFSDRRRVSSGHNGLLGDRNSMGLVNLRFTRTGLFWDERVATLEEQVLIPLQSPIEMAQELNQAVKIVFGDPRYANLFEQAFGDPGISSERLARALAQFVRALVSCQSRYDHELAAVKDPEQPFPGFTELENHGKQVFREKCRICHQNSRGQRAESFEMFASLNNGTNRSAADRDGGRGDLTFDPSDVGLFKAGSLRNIAQTAPYMHDGRFQTLEEVVDHYSHGVNHHPTVSPFVFRMSFSDHDKAALVAFLKTLTDEAFLTDPRFSDPWIHEELAVANLETTAASSSFESTPTRSETGAVAMLTVAELQAAVDAGQGIPDRDVPAWLLSLDQDGDRKLSADEQQPLVSMIVTTGAAPRLDTVRFNRQTRRVGGTGRPQVVGLMAYDRDGDSQVSQDELPEPLRWAFSNLDWNQNGRIDSRESVQWTAFERLLEVNDNGRDAARVRRFLTENLQLKDRLDGPLSLIHQEQQALWKQQAELNLELASQLIKVLTRKEYQVFRDLLLFRPQRVPATEGETAASEHLQDFDQNQDQLLDEQELQEIAQLLTESPGGFGQRRGEFPNAAQYAARLMAFAPPGKTWLAADDLPDRLQWIAPLADQDQDSKLSSAEVEEFARERGFQTLLRSGVYIGGGFGNVFSNSGDLVERLGISGRIADDLQQLMSEHRAQLQDMNQSASLAAYQALRQALK